ncbi:short subunit dehydrogenase [Flavobacterium sp. 90]|uniref:SDR family NAD(P)-dependent oxidoreductase n=2 Tax=unclassified Flavobacterium TaxID=196869 RepID=UPI000F14D326|nr:SDR family oxidoreductase [Flavobacterium sp. 90]RKR11684.1 LOW QUALITY PROTEIN: short subunit dehydrogenase [Flavobacterium sp. 81]TCK55461.1 short subunit dehydrogenase [Flavobacterium sp. 90]
MKEDIKYTFSDEEWQSCIKVLNALKENPFENPDNNLFAGLITKIHKNAKKNIRTVSYTSKKQEDLQTSLNAELVSKALNGITLFSEKENPDEQQFTELNLPKNCYCCNQSYKLAHSFYTRLCPDCAVENYAKRFQNLDLKGRNVILTGGRVKVGFATALRLLRNNANVVLTTRFPALALEQFMQESDFENWKENLIVYGLDLRNLNAINDFISFYKSKFQSLDILINNAAQTIKYTDEYYQPLIQKEDKLLDIFQSNINLIANQTAVTKEVKALEYSSGEQTEVQLTRFGQPVDNREKTSWNSTLEEISMYELVEVNLINQIAPYFLIKELKPLFLNSHFEERFIVNVTSSEGIFSYTNKTIFHPHTNMTKAALNMMTLTSAKEFAVDSIFMASVDVGWISTGAKESLRKKQFEEGYIPPLDSVDGASRIFDPIVDGINGKSIFGVLLKNYKVSQW